MSPPNPAAFSGAGVSRDTLDAAERLVRVETKLDFIIEHLKDPQPGPQMLEKFSELDRRITLLERWHNMTIGALVILNIALTFFSDNIIGLL